MLAPALILVSLVQSDRWDALPWHSDQSLTVQLSHRGELDAGEGKRELWSHSAEISGRFVAVENGLKFQVGSRQWWRGSGIADSKVENLAHALLQQIVYVDDGSLEDLQLAPIPQGDESRRLREVDGKGIALVVTKAWRSLPFLWRTARMARLPEGSRKVPVRPGMFIEVQGSRWKRPCLVGRGQCLSARVVGKLQAEDGRLIAVTQEDLWMDPTRRPHTFVQVVTDTSPRVITTVTFVLHYQD